MKVYSAVIERCSQTGLFVGFVPGFPGAQAGLRKSAQPLNFVGHCIQIPRSSRATVTATRCDKL